MIVEPFKPEHLEALVLQPAQEFARGLLHQKGYGEALAQSDSFSAIEGGRVIACAGVVSMWEGRGDAWALIAGDVGPIGMYRITKAVLRYLESSTWRRVEAACDANFEQAHRWLRMLGFTFEGPLAMYAPDGRDCLRFARTWNRLAGR